MFSKLFSRARDSIIEHAVMQLMMDWSYLFREEDLGRRSSRLLHEFCLRKGRSLRPTLLAAELLEARNSQNSATAFIRGFEFEFRNDQIALEEDCVFDTASKTTRSCRPSLLHGSFRLGSVKKIFNRSSSRNLTSVKNSPSIVQELSIRSGPLEARIEELNYSVPRDCKKLQDLLSDVQVLVSKGLDADLVSKMEVAESLRNKCVEWKQKIQDLISMKLSNDEKETEGQGEDEISPLIFTKLLTIGESLHGVLASFERIYKEYINRIQMMNQEEQQESTKQQQKYDGDEDNLLFASAKSSSSTGSIRFESTGEINWVLFNPETTQQSFQRHSRLPTDIRSSSLSPEGSLELKSDSLVKASAIPKPPPPPSMLIQVKQDFNKDKKLMSKMQRAQSIAHSSQTPLVVHQFLEKPSRSFSELKSFHDDFTNTRRISNCPALKVRFTDDHLEDVLYQLNNLR
eukprot:g4238.t1